MKKRHLLFTLIIFICTGCSNGRGTGSVDVNTHINILKSDAQSYKRPIKLFSEYAYFFIQPVSLTTELRSKYDNIEAVDFLDKILFGEFVSVFPNLGFYSEFDSSHPKKTLIIIPEIIKIKYIGKSSRLWSGLLKGSSAIVLKTTYVDAVTNTVIASPSFYQHANAFAGASNPSNDRDMLVRVAELATQYTSDTIGIK